MQATNWEFKHRALIFGFIISIGFMLFSVDHRPVYGTPGDRAARLILLAAAGIVALAAVIRTWASAYLQAQVVYAPEIKTVALVADGPYRFVRNPLYFANVLLIIGIGAMMSRSGFAASAILMVVFCYRLILREERELRAAQAQQYTQFFDAVPRLWPSLRPRVKASNRRANWKNGFKAESWYWGFALAVAAFGITFQLTWFFVVMGASLVLFWAMSKSWLLPPSA